MSGALSPTHWALILVVVLLLFGAKRLPDAARGIGRSLRIFKAETAALGDEDTESGKTEPERTGTGAGTVTGADPGTNGARPATPGPDRSTGTAA